MKKTIIALLALTGVAVGGDWTYQSTGVVSGATPTFSGGTYKGITFTLTEESDRAVWAATDEVAISDADSITLTSIAVSGKNANTSFSYSITEDEVTTTKHLGMIVVNNSGELVATSSSASTVSSKPIAGIDYTRNYGTFYFNNISLKADTQYFAYFVTQENLATIVGSENFTLTSSNFSDLTTDGVELFAFKGSNANNFSYSSSAEHNAFSHSYLGEKDTTWIPAVQIKGSYTIPEPSTATLSLLALAGLAARRRRR